MTIVKLSGGLGNQMFQYAMGRALVLRHGGRLLLDPSILLDPMPRRFAPRRRYELEKVFRAEIHLTPIAKLFQAIPIPYVPAIFGKLYGPLMGKLGRRRYIEEPTKGFVSFYPEVFHTQGNAYLFGGWQSEKYFSDFADVIREDFRFNDEIGEGSIALKTDIAGSLSICLNVRRGDKVTNPVFNKLYIVGSQEYYDRAIALMKKKVGPDIKIFVFSDDIDWCRKNLTIAAEHVFVGYEHKGAHFGGYLQLMTLCKHFIIPESSFAWWAAWLSTSKEKVVIAPEKMFQDEGIETKDAYPPAWIRI